MDDFDPVLVSLSMAQLGCFWEMRAARLAGTEEGAAAAAQAAEFAEMLTVESMMEPEPERIRQMLS